MIDKIVKIGLGFGLLWYGVLRGAKGLVVKVQDYSFRSISADGTVSLNLNLSIKNPLLVGLTIKGVTGEVYAQGQKIGTVNMSYDYYLAGGYTHVLPVVVDLQMGWLAQAAMQNIQSGDIRTLTVAFNGKIYVAKYSIPVPFQFELDYNDLTK